MRKLWFIVLLTLAACGGSGPSAPQSTAGQPASTGTVRLRTGPIHSKVGLSQQSVGGERYLVHHTDDPLTIWDQNTFSDIYLEDRDQGTCDLISRAVTGQSDGASEWATVSRDGRFVAFESTATNLVANDTNTRKDVFLYDGQTHEIRRLSTGLAGAEANGDSYDAQVSANGNLVAFVSRATNLVTGDGNGTADVFLYDIAAQTLRRINLTAAGDEVVGLDCDQPTIYEDGNFVVYVSSGTNLPGANGIPQVYATRPKTGKVWLASRNTGGESANGACSAPTFGGRTHLTFTSAASNLAADDSNGVTDVFVVSKDTLVPFLASRDDGGTPLTGNSRDSVLSSDGTKLVFVTETGGAAHDFGIESRVIRRDLTGGTNTIVSDPDEFSDGVGISDSGNFVAFATITTHQTGPDESEAVLFGHDVTVPETRQLTEVPATFLLPRGDQIGGLSFDGRIVVFNDFFASDVAEVRVFDQQTGLFEEITPLLAFSSVYGISGDGRYVPYRDHNFQTMLYDRELDVLEQMSVSSEEVPGNNSSWGPNVSDDGRYVAFRSDATNLVPGDDNESMDIFVRDRVSGETHRIAEDPDFIVNPHTGYPPQFTADSGSIVFASTADTLVAGDGNGKWDIFIYDQGTMTIEKITQAFDGGEADGHSFTPRVSADGGLIVFSSRASNLVPNDTNGVDDIFLYHRDSGSIERLSLTDSGGQANAHCNLPNMSADGRFVTFTTFTSNNLVSGESEAGLFILDRELGRLIRLKDDEFPSFSSGSLKISGDGRFLGASFFPQEKLFLLRNRASHL